MNLNPDSATNFQMRCCSCNGIFQLPSPAPCDIDVFVKFMRKLKCPVCGAKKITLGQSRTISEDDAFPHGDHPDSSIDHRLAFWLENGEIGTPARAIAAKLTEREGPTDHPRDLGDFRRCYLLLRRIPEFRHRIHRMGVVSPAWARLASKWEEIAAMFEWESGSDLDNYSAPKAAEWLKHAIGEQCEAPEVMGAGLIVIPTQG